MWSMIEKSIVSNRALSQFCALITLIFLTSRGWRVIKKLKLLTRNLFKNSVKRHSTSPINCLLMSRISIKSHSSVINTWHSDSHALFIFSNLIEREMHQVESETCDSRGNMQFTKFSLAATRFTINYSWWTLSMVCVHMERRWMRGFGCLF